MSIEQYIVWGSDRVASLGSGLPRMIEQSPFTAAMATGVASDGSTMIDKPFAPSIGDLLGLHLIFQFWPWLVPSSSLFVLNHYRALKLYDAQEPNTALALAAWTAQQNQRWWKRSPKDSVKGWWLAVLIHRLHVVFAFVVFVMFILTLTSGKRPTLPIWLIMRLPELCIFAMFWHMSVTSDDLAWSAVEALTLSSQFSFNLSYDFAPRIYLLKSIVRLNYSPPTFKSLAAAYTLPLIFLPKKIPMLAK
jgi:hypothetical protein